jgi:hypothetical protein
VRFEKEDGQRLQCDELKERIVTFGPRAKVLVLLLLSSLRVGAEERDRPVLYAVYATDILVRLQRIHAHPDRDGPLGTLVAALRGRTPAYVQCRFADNGGELLCEVVASDYPSRAPGRSGTEIEEKLWRLGYLPGAGGRPLFRYQITKDSGIWGGAAVTILKPLIDVFGARATSRIDIIAPLAAERDEAAIRRQLMR